MSSDEELSANSEEYAEYGPAEIEKVGKEVLSFLKENPEKRPATASELEKEIEHLCKCVLSEIEDMDAFLLLLEEQGYIKVGEDESITFNPDAIKSSSTSTKEQKVKKPVSKVKRAISLTEEETGFLERFRNLFEEKEKTNTLPSKTEELVEVIDKHFKKEVKLRPADIVEELHLNDYLDLKQKKGKETLVFWKAKMSDEVSWFDWKSILLLTFLAMMISPGLVDMFNTLTTKYTIEFNFNSWKAIIALVALSVALVWDLYGEWKSRKQKKSKEAEKNKEKKEGEETHLKQQ